MSVHPRSARAGPTALAATLALAYLIVAPRSPDLAAQLLRVKLFDAAGFTLWDNWWYAGHYTLGYSVLFPPLAALVTPRLLAALAAVASAATFERITHDERAHAPHAPAAALWFGAATVTPLLSGRLTFAVGLAPMLLTVRALLTRHSARATAAAALTSLASPVAALGSLLAGVVARSPATIAGALAPIALTAILFPSPGHEPFALSAYLPLPLIAIGIAALATRRFKPHIAAGALLYLTGATVAVLIPTPVGGNATRLAVLLAGPVAALLVDRKHRRAAALPLAALLYLQFQAAVSDVATTANDPSTTAAYYQPLLRYLHTQTHGAPTRIEVPFTRSHWEAYELPPGVLLARGWERQTDIGDNGLFYANAPLTPGVYDAWLHRNAIAFIALPDVPLDTSALQERALIQRHPTFLDAPVHVRHWTIYPVAEPTPIVAAPATLAGLTADTITIAIPHATTTRIAVRYSRYWNLTGVTGALTDDDGYLRLTARTSGTARLSIGFTF